MQFCVTQILIKLHEILWLSLCCSQEDYWSTKSLATMWDMLWEQIVGKERTSFLGISNHREFRLKEFVLVFSLNRLRIWYWTKKLVEGGSGSSECSFSRLPLALFLPGALFFVCQDQPLPCWPGSAQRPRAASVMWGNSPLWGWTGQLCVPRLGEEDELPRGLAGCVLAAVLTPWSLLGSSTNVTSASRAWAPRLRCLWEPGLETKELAQR